MQTDWDAKIHGTLLDNSVTYRYILDTLAEATSINDT